MHLPLFDIVYVKQAMNQKGGLIFFRPKTYAGSWSGKDKLNFLLRILKRIAVRIPLETSLHSPLLTKSTQSNSFALISAQVLPILLNHHHMAHELWVVSPRLNFALSQRCRQIDDALVRGSPETQRDIVMRLHKRAIHQHIDSRQ